MSWQRKYDFQAGSKISSSQIDEEFNQLIAAANQLQTDDNAKDADLRSKAQMMKVTTDTGGVKISITSTSGNILQSIVSAGVGLHTFFAVSGSQNLPPTNISIRGIAHLSSAVYGWIYATDGNNKVFTNYLDNGTWKGWAPLSSSTQGELWTGALYPTDVHTITPTKKLSDCQNGWILAWSDYNAGTGANNFNWTTTFIPKSLATVSAAGRVYCNMLSGHNDTTGVGTQAIKAIYITDTTITGTLVNQVGENGNRVLRKILEW
jgi:hypothetical protein